MKEEEHIKKMKPYLHLCGSTTSNVYQLFVCVKLDSRVTAEFIEEKDGNGDPLIEPATHSGTPRRIFTLSFKKGVPTENPMFFKSTLINANTNKEKGVLVRRKGNEDVIITDPEQGGVGNYDDPDGDV